MNRKRGTKILVALTAVAVSLAIASMSYALAAPSRTPVYAPTSHVVAGQTVNGNGGTTKAYISLKAGEYLLWVHGYMYSPGGSNDGLWPTDCKIETANGKVVLYDMRIPILITALDPSAVAKGVSPNQYLGYAVVELPSAPIAVTLTSDQVNMFVSCQGALQGNPVSLIVEDLRLDALQVSSLVGPPVPVGNHPTPVGNNPTQPTPSTTQNPSG